MTSGNTVRLSKLVKEFNVGISTIVEFLHKKGFDIDPNPNSKVPEEAIQLLTKEYSVDISLKKESEKITLTSHRPKKESISIDDIIQERAEEESEEEDDFFLPKINLKKTEKTPEQPPKPEAPPESAKPVPEEKIKILGTIDLDKFKKVKAAKTAVKQEITLKKKKESVAGEPVPPVEKEIPVPEEVKEPEVEIPPVVQEVAEEIMKTDIPRVEDVKVIGKIDLAEINQRTRPRKKTRAQKEKEREEKKKQLHESLKPKQEEPKQEVPAATEDVITTIIEKLEGPTVVGKIELPVQKEKKGKETAEEAPRHDRKKRRKRIQKEPGKVSLDDKHPDKKKQEPQERLTRKKTVIRKEVNEEDVQKQIKDTLARLTAKGKSKGSKYRREKRAAFSEKMIAEAERLNEQKKVLKVTEFVSVNELATMMNVSVTQVISSCMQLGLFVSINQRLDAETMSIVAEEFGFSVEFVSVEIQEAIEEEADQEEQLVSRPPIVTVMGHVDHGKTSLLDYIRKTNVIAGEAGGITQHIGAYHVSLPDGRYITFLDTPGHEAFTAMRARGAQVTDIAIVIIAADDNIMPQTIEAINHAMAAGVPIVFAINKIDKPGANPEKIREALAKMNFLVEEWGGKYQSQNISAKQGTGVYELLEKVLLEADILDLKSNPNKNASGTVIESTLDKGRGYVATILVQSGTLKIGDIILAGQFFGHVKAMFNERNQKITQAGPAVPALILGINGAPQAGDKFNVMDQEREARLIANKREQLAREQGIRTQKHITLDEIGRRIAIGNFQELNLIVKGDVDGSIEALSDSLIKLSTREIQVNVIHKAVGQISESDIMLASASEAIVIGFQVRPSLAARKIAEKEQIDIRLYSIIYDAINEIKAAMQGMLSPEIKEEITGTLEILEVFKITKVGTVAGCIVRDGKISRNSKVRVIRNGIVIYTGELESLKRFKEDVKEVKTGFECGLNILNFNDIKVGDNIESFMQVEVAKQL